MSAVLNWWAWAETVLGLPPDVVRLLMQDIGLGARESGLNAMMVRIKRHAADLQSISAGGAPSSPTP